MTALRPLSARSVLLSLLLGAHPAEMSAAALVGVATDLGLSESSVRVALTRLVAAGDLTRDASVHRLSPRLLDRQRHQDEALDPEVVVWDGSWEIVTVTAPAGRSPESRADLRAQLAALRLAELREGVWLRPANLARPVEVPDVTRFVGRPDDDPHELAARLWNLDAWATTGHDLITSLDSPDPLGQMTAAAAIVRHLRIDPVLPPSLRPPSWPALHDAYSSYKHHLTSGITSL